MNTMLVTDPKINIEKNGFLNIELDPELDLFAEIERLKKEKNAIILAHYYQEPDIQDVADYIGDSLGLAQKAEKTDADIIVFAGVHFMAESADILTSTTQKVILPDLAAGCSMADMATASQVQECWKQLSEIGIANKTIPVTYMNSSAAIKSFTGEHGGTICTSSNAQKTMEWALTKGSKILFLPDQHLGRNTAVRDLGMSLDDCVVWDPHRPSLTAEELRELLSAVTAANAKSARATGFSIWTPPAWNRKVAWSSADRAIFSVETARYRSWWKA